MNNIYKLIYNEIKKYKKIYIARHIGPDPDAFGSQMSLKESIKLTFPEKEVFAVGTTVSRFKYFGKVDKVNSYDYENGLLIVVDTPDNKRVDIDNFLSFKNVVKIDHHPKVDKFSNVEYIREDASSASELVYEVLDQDKISNDIAECLYTGMVHDTGVFQYSCTSAKTMNVAGRLMEMGIDYPKIVDDTFYTKTFNQNQILGLALLKSELHLDGKVIVSVITQEEMKKYDVLPKHLDGIVNQLRVTKGVEVALFLYETEDKEFKGSLRVNGNVNVAKVASHFGGGGHIKAAGFSVSEPYDVAIPMILDVIKEQL